MESLFSKLGGRKFIVFGTYVLYSVVAHLILKLMTADQAIDLLKFTAGAYLVMNVTQKFFERKNNA